VGALGLYSFTLDNELVMRGLHRYSRNPLYHDGVEHHFVRASALAVIVDFAPYLPKIGA